MKTDTDEECGLCFHLMKQGRRSLRQCQVDFMFFSDIDPFSRQSTNSEADSFAAVFLFSSVGDLWRTARIRASNFLY